MLQPLHRSAVMVDAPQTWAPPRDLLARLAGPVPPLSDDQRSALASLLGGAR